MATIENSTDAIVVLNEQGEILSFNKAATSLFGYPAADIVASHIDRLFCQNTPGGNLGGGGLFDEIRNIRRDDEYFEYTAIKNNGDLFSIETACTRINVNETQVIVLHVRDASSRKKSQLALQKSEQRLQRAESLIHVGYWELDLVSYEQNWSDELYHIFGISPESSVDHQRIFSLIHAVDRENLKGVLLGIANSGESREIEFRVVRPSGEIREIHALFESLKNDKGRLIGLFGAAQDITERKQAEEMSRQTHEEKIKAQAENQAKTKYLAKMSHEIRTPLTAIIGFAESLLEHDGSIEERHDALNTIYRNGRHLLGLLNHILDLSKIEAGSIDIARRPVQLFEFLPDLESLVRSQAEKKGLDFWIGYEFPLPDRIVTDPLRLKQILINLCNNAIKFTEQGSIRIIVSFHRDEQKMLFSVIDTGIGLTLEQQINIFNEFIQADASTYSKYGGTGLGLSITKQFAEKLGGTITSSSIVDVGSRFTVTIDTGQVDDDSLVNELPEIKRESSAKSVTNKDRLRGNILLAEDTPDNQKLISMYIRKSGATVDVVGDGQQAVEKALAGDYDLVLMDIQMPVMNGLEAISLLRSTGFRTPIVALTAEVMKEEVESCYHAGCDDLLTKPINVGQFYEVLATHLKSVSQQDGDHAAVANNDANDDLKSLARNFVKGLPEMRDVIVCSEKDNDWDSLLKCAHDLKGMGGGFGYPELTEVASEIMLKVKSRDYTAVTGAVGVLNALIDSITTTLMDDRL